MLLNISQASELVGKHPDTIRRLIKENPDNSKITKDKKGKYLIDQEWLLGLFEQSTDKASAEPAPPATPKGVEATPYPYKLLAAQLQAMNTQISELQKIIHEKEANTTKLQDQFQQLLGRQLLPAPKEAAYAKPMQTERKKPAKAKKPRAEKPKASKPVKKPGRASKPKRRWWQR